MVSAEGVDLDLRQHTLYRMYDAGGVLLYVGITATVPARLQAHRDQFWWRDVHTIRLEHFDTREELEAAEVVAIRSENPLFNVKSRTDPKPSLRKTPQRSLVIDPADWDDFGHVADEAGVGRAQVLRAFIRWYLRVPGAPLPQGPGG